MVTAKLCFRLLPIQILLAAIGALNGIVTSLFASNFIGQDAMSAVGLFAPISMFIGAVSTMLLGGSQILSAEYKGKNQVTRTQEVFSLDMVLSFAFSVFVAVLLAAAGAFNWTGMFTNDPAVRVFFNQYLIGMSLGILPQVLGQQLSGFLSLENQTRLTLAASTVYILVNPVFNYIFIMKLGMQALGLALASVLGLWVFLIIQAQYFFTKRANFRFQLKGFRIKDSWSIVRIGAPGALTCGYLTIRGFWVNALITSFVGAVGLSAFTACNTFLNLFWAVPNGMAAVSRMLFSVAQGEEDRQTIQDIMRNALYRYVPIMLAVAGFIAIMAVPFTRLYYQDKGDPVFMMTVWGFRLLPFCMPLSLICMHFVCYGQISNKLILVRILSALDGVVDVVFFTAVLIPLIGIRSVYWANILNGTVTTVVILLYASLRNRHLPRSMDELMVIPKDFGAEESERLDISISTIEEVVSLSSRVQEFCASKGIDHRRSMLSGLAIEEMAGNIVQHGYSEDHKKHNIEVRVVHKDGSLILRIKDDCVPFDPADRRDIVDPEDITQNIGIRMVYSMAESVQYQNILGLNVLTIRMPAQAHKEGKLYYNKSGR